MSVCGAGKERVGTVRSWYSLYCFWFGERSSGSRSSGKIEDKQQILGSKRENEKPFAEEALSSKRVVQCPMSNHILMHKDKRTGMALKIFYSACVENPLLCINT